VTELLGGHLASSHIQPTTK